MDNNKIIETIKNNLTINDMDLMDEINAFLDEVSSNTPSTLERDKSVLESNNSISEEEKILAIMYLEQIKDTYVEGHDDEVHPLPEYYAIETAVKALSTQPKIEECNDCISRKNIIELFKGLEHSYPIIANSIIEIIQKLPPVEPVQNWNTEEQPQTNNMYIVTLNNKTTDFCYYRKDLNQWGMFNNHEWKVCDEVTAWKPLPESCKEDYEDN